MDVRIRLESTSPPVGNAGAAGGGVQHFTGWLDLLRVLGHLFEEPGGTSGVTPTQAMTRFTAGETSERVEGEA